MKTRKYIVKSSSDCKLDKIFLTMSRIYKTTYKLKTCPYLTHLAN